MFSRRSRFNFSNSVTEHGHFWQQILLFFMIAGESKLNAFSIIIINFIRHLCIRNTVIYYNIKM